jgi:hypothetical protein
MVNMFGKRFNTRTILIVLLVLLIIVAVCVVIINLPPQEKYHSVEEVLRNSNQYLNQTISVRGYYTFNPDPVIVSTLSTTTGRSELKLDYSNINNATDRLISGTLYIFTGKLMKDESNPLADDVILVAEDFKKV